MPCLFGAVSPRFLFLNSSPCIPCRYTFPTVPCIQSLPLRCPVSLVSHCLLGALLHRLTISNLLLVATTHLIAWYPLGSLPPTTSSMSCLINALFPRCHVSSVPCLLRLRKRLIFSAFLLKALRSPDIFVFALFPVSSFPPFS